MPVIPLPPFLVDLPRNPVVAVGLPILLGTLSGFPTSKAVNGPWYNGLRAPPLKPPRQAFGIVWPVLYACMGYASHLAVKAYDTSLTPASREDSLDGLSLYYGQLALNLAYMPIFFGLKNRIGGLLDLSVLTGTVFYMTNKLHGPTNGQSTYFLAPYCAWLTYATYLNAGYWYLNQNYEKKGKGRAQ